MKIKLTLALLFSFTFLQAQLFHEVLLQENKMTFQEIVDLTELHYDEIGRERGLGYKQFQRWQYWAERNLDAQGKVRSDEMALNAFNKFANDNSDLQRSMVGTYEEMGPMATINTSTWSSALGRISSIGLDASDDAHIIVGSPTGGVWKTTDYGDNWVPLFDDALLMDVFSLEISHANPDHYFVGLNGKVMKSIDGGLNWYDVNTPTSGLYNTMEMHPNNADIVFAINQSNGRVDRSSNGGEDFFTSMDHGSSMYDLEFHPTDPDIIYASGNDAVFKSIDGGISFTEITTGPWSGSGNTIMMAVTPIAPENLYALEEQGGGFNALYFSDDGGDTWSTLSDDACNCNNIMGYNQNSSGGQAPRDMDVIVSPLDATIIHVAGVETWRTTDSGQNWTKTTTWSSPGASNFIHADVDMLIYDGDRIIAGTDGGIYFSTNEADSWTDITSGIGVRQFYRIGASQTEIDRVTGGSQDNGTGVVKDGLWYDFVGADGMETFIDWSNEDIIYTAIQFGGLYKSYDGGQTLGSVSTPSGSGNWVTPLEQDPIVANTIYTGRDEIYKSTDGGQNWDAISGFSNGQSSDELKIAPSDNNYLYTAYDDTFYTSIDGGDNWTSIVLSIDRVNYIAVHPFNPERLAITVSGSASKVMESMDAGATWTDITANIPEEIGIECVLYEQVVDGGLYVGGNPGIYNCLDTQNPNWESILLNLPKVRVTEFDIRNNTLYLATYGRGLWKFELGCEEVTPGDLCNDGDDCTVEDAINVLCECTGVYIDADEDGFCLNDDPDDTNPCVPIECPPCTDVTLTIILDNYPEETSWTIKDDSGNTINSGGTYGSQPDGSTVMEMDCLIDGCYDFTISDTYGDGICCGYGNGSYELKETVSGVVLASGGAFETSETTNFCVLVPCDDSGMPCDDGDACTIGSVFDAACNCSGGVYTDADGDGYCVGDDPNDNDICDPDANDESCICEEEASFFFDANIENWVDGGSDCRRSIKDIDFANSGSYCIRLRDDSATSTFTSPNFTLASSDQVKVNFTYIASSMEVNEGFVLEYSVDGGASFTQASEWYVDTDFENDVRKFESVSITASFSDQTQIRFKGDAANNSDFVYIDDVVKEACGYNGACSEEDYNEFDISWGLWNDAGSDCRRSPQDVAFAYSGTRCVRLRDGSSTSNMTTNTISANMFESAEISFTYISDDLEQGEGLVLEMSTDDGVTYSVIQDWIAGPSSLNNVRYFITQSFEGPFSSTTKFRFSGLGSDNLDFVYLDDVKITFCGDASLPIIESDIEMRTRSNSLSFEMFPNPSYELNEVLISVQSSSETVSYTLMDIFGNELQSGNIVSDQFENYRLPTENLLVGTYFVRVETEGKYLVKKLIVVK